MEPKGALALLALLLLARPEFSHSNPVELFDEMRVVHHISPSLRAMHAAQLKAATQNSQALGCNLVGNNTIYAKDLGGYGQVYMFQPNTTAITLNIKVSNLTGTMPPFTSYIRIQSGMWKYRIVFGAPTLYWIHVPGSNTYEYIHTWLEDDLFPRAPGWTMAQYFNEFLLVSPSDFFIAVHTIAKIKGAVKCTLQPVTVTT